jgi:trimeric autotransporter adhesin
MKKVYLLLSLSWLCFMTTNLKAQVSGTKTIGVDYATLAAAIADLNAVGVNGNVVINVPAGYTETAPVGGFLLGSSTLNASTSATNTLTIQKSGAGANPVLSSQVGTTTTLDGIFIIQGSDYVTIDGINLSESAGNTTTTTQMEWGYALLKLQNVAPFDGCQYVTIKNCTVTLVRTNTASVGIYAGNHVSTSTTTLALTDVADAMSYCDFYANTVQNCNTGISLRGYAAPSPYTLYDQNNDIGGAGLSTGNTIQNFAGAATGSGVNLQYQNNANVAYNTINNTSGGGINATLILYGVYIQAGTNISANVQNNTIGLTMGTTASALYGVNTTLASTGTINVSSNGITANGGSTGIMYLIYFSGAISNINTSYNVFYNINVATTGTMYFIYHTGSASPINNQCIGNATGGPTTPYVNRTGASGTTYGFYNFAVSTGGTTSHIDNNFSYVNLAGSGTFYGIYEQNGGSGQNKFMKNNIISYITTVSGTIYGLYAGYSLTQSTSGCRVSNLTSGSGSVYGIYIGSSTNTDTVSDCHIYSLSGGSVYGLYMGTSGTTIRVFNDTINTLAATGVSGLAYGIYQTVGTTVEIYKNRLYDIAGNGTGSSVNGMYLNTGNVSVWNNLVGDLRTPNYTTATANSGTQLVGIYCGGGTSHTLSYNTVNINGTSVGVNFGSTAVFAATSSTTFRNNIFVNTSVPNGTGMVAAYRRSTTGLTGFQAASNNNLYYAGTPAANRVIMYDGTTGYQTINTYKTLVSPRDGASITENVSFQSLTGGGLNFLRPSTVTPTQIESNGVNISGITDDNYGTTRAGNTGYSGTGVSPDLGAVEDNYVPLDLSAPIIAYTPLAFTCITGDRTFTATVADITGVATGGLAPRVYFKKNSGSWFSNAAVLSSGTATSGTWTFTISAAAMGGLTGGDIVSYYVIAQDIAGTPNIGSSPLGVVATDVNTVSTAPTASTYNISSTLSGTYNVGVGQTYTTITAALSAYTTSCISGPVTFQLMDASYAASETFPLTVTANAYASATNTLTIRPNAGTAVSMTSGASSVAVFKFLNAAYVSIDGVNAGGASLTLNSGNTGTATCNIWLASTVTSGPGNSNIALKNMNIIGGNITSASVWGIIAGVDGASPSGTNGVDNDNITIQGNSFQKTGYAVWAGGSATTSAGGNDNWVVSGNIVGPASFSATNNLGVNGMFFRNMLNLQITGNTYQNVGLPSSTAFGVAGIYLEAGIDRVVVTNNTIRELATSSTANSYGIYLGTNVINSIVSGNMLSSLHNNNATTGSPMKAITINTTASSSNDTIVNNLIGDIYSSASATVGNNPMGITIEGTGTGGVNVWFNSVYLSGSHSGINAATKGYCLYATTTGSNLDIRNNVFVNTYDNTSSSTDKGYAIYSTASSSQYSNINYNDYYVAGPNVLGYISSTDRADLAAMQAGFGDNLNSIVSEPLFISAADAHLVPNGANVPLAAGQSIAGVTVDYDGTTRSTTPVMGGHEVNLTAIPPSMTYTNISSTCTTSDQIFTATIADPSSGVPVTGGNVPRVYFRKGAGTWYSSPGVLTSGTSASGVWTFTISATTMGGLVIGDVVSYYLVSQTNAGYVGSAPYSSAFAATNVNTVTTPPATPNSFTVLPTLSGTYNVGVGQAYTTLTSAVNAYNTSCIGGPVVFQLMDATYPSETFPIQVEQNSYSSAVNTLTIKPASGVNATISGSSTAAIIKLNGADYVTIDGSNNGTNSQNLSISNSNTTTSAVIWNASLGGATGGATNNTFKNLNVSAGANATATVIGIASGSNSSVTTGGDGNDNFTVQNCNITKAYEGIVILGTASYPHNNVLVSKNTIGSNTATNYVLYWGLNMTYQNNPVITQNTVFNMKNTALTNIIAMEFGSNIVGAQITRNNITGIWQESTGGWGAYGIDFSTTGCSNITIANNFISDIHTINYSSTSTTYNAFGIRVVSAVTDLKMYHNSINLYGSVTVSSTAGFSSNVLILAACPNIDIRNNIFSNTMTFATTGSVIYNIYSTAVSTSPTLNYNDYYKSSSATTTANVGYISGSAFATLAAWQAAVGQEANSIAILPLFVAANDLHLQSVGANAPFAAGTAIAGVTIDYDGTTRNAIPVIGAHELVLPACTGVPNAGTASASVLTGCASFTTNLSTTGTTTGVSALTYQWQSSPDGIAPYADISGATNPTYTATVSTTTYFRERVTCSATSSSDYTAGIQVVSNPNPAPITGVGTVCASTTLTLNSTTTPGTWASATPGNVSVDVSTGVATGVAAGTSVITYALGTGCYATAVVTTNPSPGAITFTPSNAQTVCFNSGATFTASSIAPVTNIYSENFNAGLGGWTVDNTGTTAAPSSVQWAVQIDGVLPGGSLSTAFHTPDNSQFVLTNADAGGSGTTTASKLVSPVFSLVGYTTASLSFQQWYQYWASGDATVAVEISTNGGSTWTLLQNYLGATIGSANAFVNGNVSLSAYAGMSNLRIRYNYSSVWGYGWAVDNVVVSGTPQADMTWAGISGADGLSCTACASPTITPTALGVNVYSVTATAGGCSRTSGVTVSVNPIPAPIGGTLQVCTGLTTTLTNASGSGTWSSGNTIIATVDVNTGVVMGVSTGTVAISYTFTSTGCSRVAILTVNALPSAIGGTAQACEAGTTTLTNSDAGGTWISTNTSTATIGSASGILTGVTAGTSLITYTLPTGCQITRVASVNPLPVLTVSPLTPTTFCIGESTSAYSASATMPSFLLLNQNFNTSLAGWTVENPIYGAAGEWQIVPSGFDGSTGDGTPMLQASPFMQGSPIHTRLVSPSFSTVGFGAASLTFNQYFLSDADPIVAVEYSVNGGAWQTLVDYNGTGIFGSGLWTATTPDETLALPAGAINQPDVKIRWNYYGGFYGWFLDNIKVSASLPPATYTWTGGSDLSCSTCTNPTITPSASGVNVYTVSAVSSASCVSNGTVTINANPLPSVFGGTLAVCHGLTTTLTNADAGGTWTSSTTSVATIDATSGLVSGLLPGTTIITYTLPTGCLRTAEFTVNVLPADITGTMDVCEGLTTTLGETTAGGTWTSGNTSAATVDASGIVSGVAAGNSTITFTISATGCIKTADVVVNPLPAVIAGTQAVCEGLTSTLTNTSTGGTWFSDNTSSATIGSTTGILSGISAGNAMITYTLPTGCIRTTEATVNALPADITGTMDVCEGLTTTLNETTPNGTWTSSNTTAATVDASGVVSGLAAGSTTITFTVTATGCIKTADVVVNPLPAVISGTQSVCEGLTTTLTNTSTGGTWFSDNMSAATIGATSGILTGVAAGNAMITYTLPTGCIRVIEATVNALPADITGTMDVCEGLTTTLNETTTGGTWTSSNTTAATVDASGVVSGLSAGSTTITFTITATGCIKTTDVVVNPLPAVIAGTQDVCEGLTTTLTNTSTGGTWFSDNTAVATIGLSSGVLSGVSVGNSMITYTLPTGCIRMTEATVNITPAPITGINVVCEGLNTTLVETTPGGTWGSSDITLATVDAFGVVTGLVAGTPVITYLMPTGCLAEKMVTVNALPGVITGTMQVCEGLTTTLSSTTTGGNWISGTTATATIGVGTGIVNGVAAGIADITYALSTGCIRTAEVTVNALPAVIAGPSQVCVASVITLTDATIGGTWTSSDASVADVTTATGIVSGIASGVATITYTLPTGCIETHNLTVNALSDIYNVTGGGSYCFGGSGVNVGMSNSQAGSTYALYLGGSLMATQPGTGGAISFGSMTNAGIYTVVATTGLGCDNNMSGSATVVITPLVTPSIVMTVNPGDTVCAGTLTTFSTTVVNGGTSPAYAWMVNGVPVTGTAATHDFTPVDGDIITVTMTSNEACPSPASVSASQVMVVVPNHTPIATIDAHIGTLTRVDGDTICQGTLVAYTASSLFGGSSPVYTWYKNAISTGSTGPVYAYVPVAGDVITMKLNSSYRCPTPNNVLSNAISLHIDTVFVPSVDIIANTGLTINLGTTVTFKAIVTNGGLKPTYQWLVNSAAISGATSDTYVSSTLADNDSVSCWVAGTGDCSYNTFNAVRMKVTTGLVDVTTGDADIRLMPNPNTGAFVVSGTLVSQNDAVVTIEVTDMLGQVVYKGNTTARHGILNEHVKLNNTLANGMYMLNVRTGTANKVFHFVLKN